MWCTPPTIPPVLLTNACSLSRTVIGPATVSCTCTEATGSSTGTSQGQEVRTSTTRARWTPGGAPSGMAVSVRDREASVAKVPLVGSTVSQGPGAGDRYSTST